MRNYADLVFRLDAVPPDGLCERRKRRTRQAISAAAYELFTSQGFDATSMEEIAARAEVAPRTLYRYFPAKLDIVTPGRTELRRRLGSVARDDASAGLLMALTDQVLAIAAWLDGLVDEDAALFELAARDATMRTALTAMLDDMAADIAGALTADPRLDVAPSDALLLASMAVVGMVAGHDGDGHALFSDTARAALRILGAGVDERCREDHLSPQG